MDNLVFLTVDTNGIFDLAVLLLVFVFILIAAYYVTKWVSNTGLNIQKNKNIKVLEVFRINQTKYIYLVKLGDKVVALGVTKDHMEFLTEINEESLNFDTLSKEEGSFKDLLKLSMNKKQPKDFPESKSKG